MLFFDWITHVCFPSLQPNPKSTFLRFLNANPFFSTLAIEEQPSQKLFFYNNSPSGDFLDYYFKIILLKFFSPEIPHFASAEKGTFFVQHSYVAFFLSNWFFLYYWPFVLILQSNLHDWQKDNFELLEAQNYCSPPYHDHKESSDPF